MNDNIFDLFLTQEDLGDHDDDESSLLLEFPDKSCSSSSDLSFGNHLSEEEFLRFALSSSSAEMTAEESFHVDFTTDAFAQVSDDDDNDSINTDTASSSSSTTSSSSSNVSAEYDSLLEETMKRLDESMLRSAASRTIVFESMLNNSINQKTALPSKNKVKMVPLKAKRTFTKHQQPRIVSNTSSTQSIANFLRASKRW
eukprot:scaffold1514_cov118-Cylindrotheca_fusiformis.AAC.4